MEREAVGETVPMPTLPDEFQMPEPGNQAAFATVRYVVEALVICPLVDQKLVAVKLVDEAFSVYVVVATARFPAKNPLPFTERSWPGVVVPMPTRPALTGAEDTVDPLYIPVPYIRFPMFNCWLEVTVGASTFWPITMLYAPVVMPYPALYPRRVL